MIAYVLYIKCYAFDSNGFFLFKHLPGALAVGGEDLTYSNVHIVYTFIQI